jgi:hypothetical protein
MNLCLKTSWAPLGRHSSSSSGDEKGGDRQDVPHESVSEDFLGSAWAALIIFFWPRVASFLRPPRPLHGRREDAQY